MGTSNAYKGPKGNTPLIPSWLVPDGDAPNGENDSQTTPQPPIKPPIPPEGDKNRFRGARSNYSRFAGSGGRNTTNLRRAISNYVSQASGGAKNAAQRMGASRIVGTKLTGFLSNVVSQGVRQALKALNFENLAGRPIEEIFLGLTDYICPDGGTIDEGIAREAFIETIAALVESGIESLDGMTLDQVLIVFELYTTYSIEARICNDIGTKTIILPTDAREVANVQLQLHDFIRRGVADAINRARSAFQELTPERVQEYVYQVYEQAFIILQTIGEAEGDEV